MNGGLFLSSENGRTLMNWIVIGCINNDNPNYTYLLTITQKNYLRQFFYVPIPSRSLFRN